MRSQKQFEVKLEADFPRFLAPFVSWHGQGTSPEAKKKKKKRKEALQLSLQAEHERVKPRGRGFAVAWPSLPTSEAGLIPGTEAVSDGWGPRCLFKMKVAEVGNSRAPKCARELRLGLRGARSRSGAAACSSERRRALGLRGGRKRR